MKFLVLSLLVWMNFQWSVDAQTLDQTSPWPTIYDQQASFNMYTPGLYWQQSVMQGLTGYLYQVDLYKVSEEGFYC